MISLSAFGEIPEREAPLGYVGHRNTGWRIFIAIDDMYNTPVSPDDDAKSAHAYGLKPLYKKLSELDSTRAIGFFSLPDPGNKIAKPVEFEAETQRLISEISRWMLSVKDDSCRGYFLVDYFYGEGFYAANEAGMDVVRQWKRQETRLLTELGLPIKLAHISIGGAKMMANPYNLPIFSKGEMDLDKPSQKELRTWLDIDENPISRLWRESRHWFLAGRDSEDIMRHTAGNIQEYLNSADDGRLDKYKGNVEAALGLQFPDSWWQHPESIGFIHESLKCLCGAMFCGESTDDSLKRPVSTGAAFLIALLAHKQVCGSIAPFISNERIWSNCPRASTSFVFPKQDCITAQASTIALYDLFMLLFEVKYRTDNSSARRTSQVNRILFKDGGRFLIIELAWNAHRRAIDGGESLSERGTKLFKDTPIRVPAKSPKNTREAMLKLWSLMAINEEGCFSPGIVHINKNMLTIGSVM